MLKVTDLRKTTRRTGADGARVVYPHFLRDRALAPRIELMLRYLESMLGHTRSELDQEVIVQLFGDHKIAHCLVAALATSYRHRARTFEEVVPAEQVAALQARGLCTPSQLRLWVYERANRAAAGFVGAAERAAFLRDAAGALEVPQESIERLLTLDLAAHAVLVRTGPKPTADDVIARYNYETAAALLANASLLRLSLRAVPAEAEARVIRGLATHARVRADLAGRELTLHGQQDAFEGWARHGARLVRLVSGLLMCGLDARAGEALVAAPTGGTWTFRLDGEVLGYVGAPARLPASAWLTGAELLAAWERMDGLAGDFAATRRAGGGEGWALRRAGQPLVMAEGVVPALFTATRGEARVVMVPAPATEPAQAALAEMANRLPLVALELVSADGDVARHAVGREGRGRPGRLRHAQRGDAAALPTLLAQAVAVAESNGALSRVRELLEEVARARVMTEPRVAEWLGCAEEEVPARLAAPQVRALWTERGVRYIEGFGLCRAEVLAQAREAAADVARLRGDQLVGPAWTARVLGRRLREVTGATERIECLIAYLGAA